MRLLRNYLWWTYDRGSLHYDVMVTVILLFLFLSPRFIDYRDRPTPDLPDHNNEILVRDEGVTNGTHQYAYEVRTGRLHGDTSSDEGLRTALLDAVQPLTGGGTVQRYESVKDAHGSTVAYTVWVTH